MIFIFNDLNRFILNSLNLNISDVQSIKSIKNNDDDSFYINVIVKKTKSSCTFCNSNNIVFNGFYSKKIINTNNIYSKCIINIKIPRLLCKNCSKSFSNKLYLTPNNSKFSYKVIQSILDLLKQPNNTFSSVSKLLSIPETSIIRIFDKYVHIPRLSLPKAICIDEIYTKLNSYKSKYSCVIYDFISHKLIDITPSRRKNYLHHYLQSIPKSELDNVQFVCIDMYLPYKQICQLYFKKAAICIDSFHVIKNLNDSLSNIRIRIMKNYNPNSIEYYILKNFNFLLLNRKINLDSKPKYNHKLNKYLNLRQILNILLSINKDLEIAYYLKEQYVIFNQNTKYEEVSEKLESIIYKFSLANIPEYNDFLTTLINWKQEIINSFIIYKNRRINNGVAESMNSIIATVIYNSKGIRNHDRRRKRIMYVINKSGFNL